MPEQTQPTEEQEAGTRLFTDHQYDNESQIVQDEVVIEALAERLAQSPKYFHSMVITLRSQTDLKIREFKDE